MIGIDTQDIHPRGCVLSRGGNSDLYLIKHELCTCTVLENTQNPSNKRVKVMVIKNNMTAARSKQI
jgi:hypothetical protein